MTSDRRIGNAFVDWSRIDIGLADWQWIGDGSAMGWRIGDEFGDGLVDWSRIDIRLAMDWRWMGGLVVDYDRIGGLVMEWRRIGGLAEDWGWIGDG